MTRRHSILAFSGFTMRGVTKPLFRDKHWFRQLGLFWAIGLKTRSNSVRGSVIAVTHLRLTHP
jgi:hypothetical protein